MILGEKIPQVIGSTPLVLKNFQSIKPITIVFNGQQLGVWKFKGTDYFHFINLQVYFWHFQQSKIKI